jgi:hypothetical protein
MGPLEDALAEQRRRSDAMTAALRHARYAPEVAPTAASVDAADDDPDDDGPHGDATVDPRV